MRTIRELSQRPGGKRPERDRSQESSLDAAGAGRVDGAEGNSRDDAIGDEHDRGILQAITLVTGFPELDLVVLALHGPDVFFELLMLQVNRGDEIAGRLVAAADRPRRI